MRSKLKDAAALIDAWVQRVRDTTHAAAIQAAADKIDEIIPEEFRKGHESIDGPRSEIVTKYTRRAVLAITSDNAQRLYDLRIKEAQLNALLWSIGATPWDGSQYHSA